MPKQPTKGKAQIAAELTAEVVEQFKEYARGRGEKLSAALERALRREMAYPPPLPEPPPLPPLEPLPDAAPAGKGR